MRPRAPWDLVVLGGGTAGIVAAKTAARLGARTLLVEGHRTGGDCLWTGCVPSKALIVAASAAASARASHRFGVTTGDVTVDFARVMEHVHGAVTTIAPIDSPEALTAAGVTVLAGRGQFVGEGMLDVDGEIVRFRQALVTTGAAPTLPRLTGLESVEALTSDTVWDLREAPERLTVLGGGSIGCELGQAMARLGMAVTIIESASRILPQEDADASAAIGRALVSDGVTLRVGRTAVAVTSDDGRAGVLRLDDGTTVSFDRLLVAVGRTPRTADIGLDTIGVEVDDRGRIVVDDRLRTTNPRVWAAGDLTGHPQFTHTAGVHGSLAASNAVLGVARRVDTAAIPRVTFTQPEVAAVGVDTSDATGRTQGGLRQLTQLHREVDRAVVEAETDGFTRLVVDRKGRIVGATVVGPRAGETLGELAIAVRQGLHTRDLASVMHAYPTWNDGPWNAAVADVRTQLEAPATRLVLSLLVRVRRLLLARRDR